MESPFCAAGNHGNFEGHFKFCPQCGSKLTQPYKPTTHEILRELLGLEVKPEKRRLLRRYLDKKIDINLDTRRGREVEESLRCPRWLLQNYYIARVDDGSESTVELLPRANELLRAVAQIAEVRIDANSKETPIQNLRRYFK